MVNLAVSIIVIYFYTQTGHLKVILFMTILVAKMHLMAIFVLTEF